MAVKHPGHSFQHCPVCTQTKGMIREDERFPVRKLQAAIYNGPLQARGRQPADDCAVSLSHIPGVAHDVPAMAILRRPDALGQMDPVVNIPEIQAAESRS
jgi:hypothetical protein